jgi:hypothetical protein
MNVAEVLQDGGPSAAEILGDTKVAEIFDGNQFLRARLRQASEQLEGKPDAIAAMHKILPSLAEQKVKIFVSYKLADVDTARAVVQTLRAASAKLDIRFADDITVGTQWRDYIVEHTATANWLILLMTDPDVDWDWCLFECGRFEACMAPSADRLICLIPPRHEPPSQLSHYQAVEATPEKVRALLKDLFVSDAPLPGFDPINPNANLDAATDSIIAAFQQRQRVQSLERDHWDEFIEIELPGGGEQFLVDPSNPTAEETSLLGLASCEQAQGSDRLKIQSANRSRINLHNLEILKLASIRNTNSRTLAIFGWHRQPDTFGELTSRIVTEESDNRWLYELARALKFASLGQSFHPVQAIFRADTRDRKTYRPLLHATSRVVETKAIDSHHIIFVEDVTTIYREEIPDKAYAALAEVVKITYRFRWEVLAPCRHPSATNDDIERAVVALQRIEAEAQSRGFTDQELVISALNDEDATRVRSFYGQWFEIRSPDPDSPRALDIALRNEDWPEIKRLLCEVWPMNKEFLVIAARTFARMSAALDG